MCREKLYKVLIDLNVAATKLGKQYGVHKPYINTNVYLKDDAILREINKVIKFIKHPEYSYLKK